MTSQHPSWLFSRTGAVTAGAIAILGFLVYEGHGAHLLGLVPYLFLLACPLMHIFMHGGHHHGDENTEGHHHGDEKSEGHSHGGGCCGGHDEKKTSEQKPTDSKGD